MIILAHAAAALVALLGVLHLAYTLHDFGPRPRYFRPSDERLLETMRAAKTAVAPNGRDYWSGVLGFNLSHTVGVMLFALLIVVATLHTITWLKPLLVAVGITYGLISYRCWFIVPTVGIFAATTLLIIGWAILPIPLIERAEVAGATSASFVCSWPVASRSRRSVPDDRVDKGNHVRRSLFNGMYAGCPLLEVKQPVPSKSL